MTPKEKIRDFSAPEITTQLRVARPANRPPTAPAQEDGQVERHEIPHAPQGHRRLEAIKNQKEKQSRITHFWIFDFRLEPRSPN